MVTSRLLEAFLACRVKCYLLAKRLDLSEEAVAEFTTFFLETCLDQIAFMQELMQPDKLRVRVLVWADEQTKLGKLPRRSGQLLAAAL